jgi:hypothetical protein
MVESTGLSNDGSGRRDIVDVMVESTGLSNDGSGRRVIVDVMVESTGLSNDGSGRRVIVDVIVLYSKTIDGLGRLDILDVIVRNWESNEPIPFTIIHIIEITPAIRRISDYTNN